jgi:hypothetical protein
MAGIEFVKKELVRDDVPLKESKHWISAVARAMGTAWPK